MIALYHEGGSLRLADVASPELKDGEAVIRVSFSGVCNTDLEIMQGYMNFVGIPGHEFVGVVEACGNSDWVGKRVVGEINCGCGKCDFCLRSLSRHCPNRTVLGIMGRNGCHGQFVSLPISNLHFVPENVSDEEAVFTEPLAAALEILEQVHLPPETPIAVIGDGKLGQLVARVLLAFGYPVTVWGKHAVKLERLERLGASVRFPGENTKEKYECVIECCGNFSGLEKANQLLLPRGTLVLKSTYHGESSFNPAAWIIDEITVVGSRCGPFEPALRLLSRKMVTVSDLISDIVPGVRAVEAMAKAREKNTLKILIDWR